MVTIFLIPEVRVSVVIHVFRIVYNYWNTGLQEYEDSFVYYICKTGLDLTVKLLQFGTIYFFNLQNKYQLKSMPLGKETIKTIKTPII